MKPYEFSLMLKKAGYKEIPVQNYDSPYMIHRFYSQKEFTPLCQCNNHSFMTIDLFQMHNNFNDFHYSASIEIRMEVNNGHWCNLEWYSIPLDKFDLKDLEDRLINAWKALNYANDIQMEI